jgi:hypothetical protein
VDMDFDHVQSQGLQEADPEEADGDNMDVDW